MHPLPLDNPRIIRAWTFFDWANSAFALVITTAIFPAYFLAVTDTEIPLFGSTLSNSALYAYSISASYLIIALCSPILSGIADYGGRKKGFLKFFTTLGALSCLALFFFQGMPQLLLGITAFILAMIGFAGGIVFYNAYLPEISSPENYDNVSAKGYAMGYYGSVLLLVVNLIIIQKPGWFGLPEGTLPARVAFVLVGLWWLGFSLIPFRVLQDTKCRPFTTGLLWKGFQELRKVAAIARTLPSLTAFLAAFFFYSAGVQTVIYLAATFAEKELEFGTSELILVVLILQLVAVAGAFLFARVSQRFGNKTALMAMLFIWVAICLFAYFVQNRIQFYLIAAAVGAVMGGIQATSRSTYAKLLPVNTPDTASFFSFYDVLEKLAIVLGTFSFGYLDYLTGSMRTSILFLTVYFLMGSILLVRVSLKRPPSERHPA